MLFCKRLETKLHDSYTRDIAIEVQIWLQHMHNAFK